MQITLLQAEAPFGDQMAMFLVGLARWGKAVDEVKYVDDPVNMFGRENSSRSILVMHLDRWIDSEENSQVVNKRIRLMESRLRSGIMNSYDRLIIIGSVFEARLVRPYADNMIELFGKFKERMVLTNSEEEFVQNYHLLDSQKKTIRAGSKKCWSTVYDFVMLVIDTTDETGDQGLNFVMEFDADKETKDELSEALKDFYRIQNFETAGHIGDVLVAHVGKTIHLTLPSNYPINALRMYKNILGRTIPFRFMEKRRWLVAQNV